MDPALISAVFAGLTGLIGATAAAVSNRRRKIRADLDRLDEEMFVLRGQIESAKRYIHQLRSLLAELGVDAPHIPAELQPRTKGTDDL